MVKIKNHEIFFTCIMFFILYFGHNGQRHYWSILLKVLRCNGYNTKLQNYNLLNINVIRYYPNWGNTLFIYGSWVTKSSLTTLTMTTLTAIKNQAHPLWSEPDCIRSSCHVSPELLVTSAVKSPLVRRKVRPWACQPYTSKNGRPPT